MAGTSPAKGRIGYASLSGVAAVPIIRAMPTPTDNAAVRGPSVRAVPEGDNRERTICADCGYILYDNPKVVVGSVVRWGDRILLCRRSIEPRRGFWTLPAGYMELHESTVQTAEREAWEEALAKITIDGLLAVYSIPRI